MFRYMVDIKLALPKFLIYSCKFPLSHFTVPYNLDTQIAVPGMVDHGSVVRAQSAKPEALIKIPS